MIEFRSLKESEIDAWLDHCMIVFNKGEYSEGYRNYFRNHLMNDPWRNLDDILIAVDGDRIVSTVRIFNRKVYMFGAKLRMGGIGEVSTQPSYERIGLSSALLHLAIKKMEENGVHISMLGASVVDFYQRLGWQNYGRRLIWATVPTPFEQSGLIVRPVRWEPEEKQALMQLYAHYSKKWNGPIVRDHPDYWKNWVTCEAKELLVAENEKGEIVGYIAYQVDQKKVRIREFVAPLERIVLESFLKKIQSITADRLEQFQIAKQVADQLDIPLEVIRTDWDPCGMSRLITPFEAHNIAYESTEQLIEKVLSEGFVYWEIDNF